MVTDHMTTCGPNENFKSFLRLQYKMHHQDILHKCCTENSEKLVQFRISNFNLVMSQLMTS